MRRGGAHPMRRPAGERLSGEARSGDDCPADGLSRGRRCPLCGRTAVGELPWDDRPVGGLPWRRRCPLCGRTVVEATLHTVRMDCCGRRCPLCGRTAVGRPPRGRTAVMGRPPRGRTVVGAMLPAPRASWLMGEACLKTSAPQGNCRGSCAHVPQGNRRGSCAHALRVSGCGDVRLKRWPVGEQLVGIFRGGSLPTSTRRNDGFDLPST